MVKLTPDIKEYIQKNLNLSNRTLAGQIRHSFLVTVSHGAVGRYKKRYRRSLDTFMDTSELLKSIQDPIKRMRKTVKMDALDTFMDTSEKITSEEAEFMFNFFEKLGRKRWGLKKERTRALELFFKFVGVKK